MKFYIEDSTYCKMKLILAYFGEKNSKNCGQCTVCEKNKKSIFGKNIHSEIIGLLEKKSATIEELSIQLNFHEKEDILENLIFLLDLGKVKMLNFRTYAVVWLWVMSNVQLVILKIIFECPQFVITENPLCSLLS